MLMQDTKLRMTKRMIQKYLKEELNLVYKKAEPISFRHNLLDSKL
jgi:hypothetical protein